MHAFPKKCMKRQQWTVRTKPTYFSYDHPQSTRFKKITLLKLCFATFLPPLLFFVLHDKILVYFILHIFFIPSPTKTYLIRMEIYAKWAHTLFVCVTLLHTKNTHNQSNIVQSIKTIVFKTIFYRLPSTISIMCIFAKKLQNTTHAFIPFHISLYFNFAYNT